MQEKEDYAELVHEAKRRVVLAQTRSRFNVDSRVLGDTATPLFIEHSVADLIITNCDFLFRGKQVFLLDMSDGSYTLPYVISADVTAEHILRLVPGVGDALHRHLSNWCVDFDTDRVLLSRH
jgi:adenylosuccinate synthase